MTPKQVLQDLGVRLADESHHHSTEGWLQTDCPQCSPGSGKFRLGLRFPNAASCWVCGPMPLWKEALAELIGKPQREIREAFSGCSFPQNIPSTAPGLRTGRFSMPRGVCPLSKPFRAYIRSRGLSVAMLRDVYGVRGIGPAGGRLSWRLYIPIRIGMETVSFTTRSIDDDSPRRYISASADQERVPHKSLLYGVELARHAVAVCYSSDTEVLTNKGWVKFPNLTKNDAVAQYNNPGTKDGAGEINFVRPTAIQKFFHKGDMVNYTAEWCDLLVTQDHRMLVRRQKCFPKVVPAKDFGGGMYIPTAGFAKTKNVGPSPIEARLIVSFLADGHWERNEFGRRGNKIRWTFYKKRKQDRFRRILNRLNITHLERDLNSVKGGKEFSIQKTDMPRRDLFDGRKRWPYECLSWSEKTRKAMLDEIPYWDGDKPTKTSCRFFTSKKRSVNVVTALAAITGWSTNTRRRKGRKAHHSDEWVVNMLPDKQWRGFASKTQSTIPYKGKVYCCTVPSGFLVVRRNYKVAIAGNCEGPLDAMSLGPGGVATFGVNYTEAQLVKMTKFPVRVVVADNEPDAIRRAEKLVSELEVYPGKTVLFIPSGKDLLSSPPREREWLRRKYLR